MNTLLSSVDWDSLLSSDLASSWTAFKTRLLSVAYSCIPSKLLPQSSLPPWIPHSLVPQMKLRQELYCQTKSHPSPSTLAFYQSLRNSITSSLRESKSSFFARLSSQPPSKFLVLCQTLHRFPSTVPSLHHLNKILFSDSDKAECLNSFTSCFSSSAPPLSSISPHSSPPDFPTSLLCSEDNHFPHF